MKADTDDFVDMPLHCRLVVDRNTKVEHNVQRRDDVTAANS